MQLFSKIHMQVSLKLQYLKKTTVVVESLSNNTTKYTVPENTSLLQDTIPQFCTPLNFVHPFTPLIMTHILVLYIKSRSPF